MKPLMHTECAGRGDRIVVRYADDAGENAIEEAERRGRLVRGETADGREAVAPQTASRAAGPAQAPAPQTFRRGVARAWLAALRRRSQRHRLPWDRFGLLLDRFLPGSRIVHPEPGVRFDAMPPR